MTDEESLIFSNVSEMIKKRYPTHLFQNDIYDRFYDDLTHTECNSIENIDYIYDLEDIQRNRQPKIRFHLLITLYDEKNPERINELLFCLEHNIKNVSIDQIHILYEMKDGSFEEHLTNSKINLTKINYRPSFNDLIDYGNKIGGNIILANSDVIFTDSLDTLTEEHIEDRLFAITRKNIIDITDNKCKCDDMYNYGSQDAWIYRAPFDIDMYAKIGTFTSDSFLNAECFQKSNKQIFNISADIDILHYQNGKNDSSLCGLLSSMEKYEKYIKPEIEFQLRRDSPNRILIGLLPISNIMKLDTPTIAYPLGHDHRCGGCDNCDWRDFFPEFFRYYDRIISATVPSIFDVGYNIIHGIRCDNILKLYYSINGDDYFEAPFHYKNKIATLDYPIEGRYLRVYYRNLIDINESNLITFNNLKDKSVVIAGIIRNGQNYLDRAFANLDRISSYFGNCCIYIYENNSNDSSKDMLKRYAYSRDNVVVECEDINEWPNHYQTMAYARNKCRDYILKQNREYVLLIDLDLRIDISAISVMNAFFIDCWDAQFANSVYDYNYHYWDTFALRTKNHNIPFWYEEDPQTGLNKYWSIVTNIPKTQKPMNYLKNVISAFGGIAIYRRKCFEISRYDENVHDCEHVPFHTELYKKGMRLIVNPLFMKAYHYSETEFSFYDKDKFDLVDMARLLYEFRLPKGTWIDSARNIEVDCNTLSVRCQLQKMCGSYEDAYLEYDLSKRYENNDGRFAEEF